MHQDVELINSAKTRIQSQMCLERMSNLHPNVCGEFHRNAGSSHLPQYGGLS